MSEKLVASSRTIERQAKASDPATSIWVSANAGSGKTTVLAQRVVKLLLAGVEPARILCLTFTKAAAANMANRVFRDLSVFATLDDAALDTALQRFGLSNPTPAKRAQARRLFAQALDTPGGLKVLTIHAFCERILHQFTLESGVPADFSVLDDQKKAEIIAQAHKDVFATIDSDTELKKALLTLLGHVSAATMESSLNALLNKPELMTLYTSDTSLKALYERLSTFFAIPDGLEAGNLKESILSGSLLRPHTRLLIDTMLNATTKGDQENAQRLIAAFDPKGDDDPTAVYLSIFLKKDGDFAKKPPLNAAARKANPALADAMDMEVERLKTLLNLQKALAIRAITHALFVLTRPIFTRYQHYKRLHSALDFSDLILATRKLLENDQSAWVLYKLDGGIDHVLVDEAQDTSPDQWAIVRALTAEFTAGESARSPSRTVFAVGDEKQSIYSFQGASPDEFGTMRTAYGQAHAHAHKAFEALELTQSFRSAGAILEAVDKVFAPEMAHRGLESAPKATHHETARQTAYGRVELWPMVLTERLRSEDTAWDAPLDTPSTRSGPVMLASRLASGLKNWINGQHPVAPGEKIQAGDILILLRSRSPLFNAIIRELKAQGLPVAGADRLQLSTHIIVLDLLALGDALLQEQDDLQLASVLKSPLFGFDDRDLIQLAPERTGSLRQALRQSPAPHHQAACALLDQWCDEAQQLSPYRFYTQILGRDRGRHAITARMGVEAEDILDEFQRLSLDYSAGATPTLSGFLRWMRAADVQVKRDQEIGGQEIRVMTAHGAKGLEARVVIVADLCKPPTASKVPAFFSTRESGLSENAPDLPIWSPGPKYDCNETTALREKELTLAEAEHRRLLYVALTRAQDRLVIAGHTSQSKEGPSLPPLSWYGLALAGLQGDAHTIPAESLGGDVLVYESDLAPHTLIDEAATAPDTGHLPPWLFSKAAEQRSAMAALTPSSPAVSSPADKAGLIRGTMVHDLLQKLAQASPERRKTLIANSVSEHAEEALAVLEHPDFADIFGTNSRSEVDIAGTVVLPNGTRGLRGRIDRLVVTDNTVLLVDFKTDAHVPDTVPSAYIRQLALYRAALTPIFPHARIEATIIWTRNLRRDTVHAEKMDTALAMLS